MSETRAIAAKSPATSRLPQDSQRLSWSSRTGACRAFASITFRIGPSRRGLQPAPPNSTDLEPMPVRQPRPGCTAPRCGGRARVARWRQPHPADDRERGKADDRVRDQSDRGQVAGNEPLAAGLTTAVVVQPNRSLPRVRFHHFPYRPGTSWPATGAPRTQQTSSRCPSGNHAQGAPLRDGECPRNCVGMNERDAHAFNQREEVLRVSE